MAHDLSIRADGRAEMAYVGEVPWHGLGTKVDGAMTAKEALTAAGLDWSIVKAPTYYADPSDAGQPRMAEGFNTLLRSDNRNVLHVARATYGPLNNVAAFAFADNIAGTGDAKYLTAGALDGGRKVWMLAELAKCPLLVAGDEVLPYFLLHNSHDGSSKVRGILTPTRVVCRNTLSAALAGARAGEGFALRHTKVIHARADDARRALGVILKGYDSLGERFNLLASKSFSDMELTHYVNEVFPFPVDGGDRAFENARTRHKEAVRLAHEGAGNDRAGVRGTWWAAYNGATELLDHSGKWRTSEGRMKDCIFGGRATAKAHALSLAAHYAGTAS